MLNKPDFANHVTSNVYFDTWVYHPPGIDLLAEMINIISIRVGSEMVGAVRNIDLLTVSVLTTQNAILIGPMSMRRSVAQSLNTIPGAYSRGLTHSSKRRGLKS